MRDVKFLLFLLRKYPINTIKFVIHKLCKTKKLSYHKVFGMSYLAMREEYDNGAVIRLDNNEISFLGDVSLADNKCVARKYDERGKGLEGILSKEVIEYLQSQALVIANGEFTVGKGGEALPKKKYTYKADPARLPIFHEMNVGLVTLANNHVFDYGMDVFLQTLDAYDEHGLKRIGAGRNIEEASKAVYYIVNGYKIAFINANRSEKYRYTPRAKKQEPGVFKCYNTKRLVETIKKEKEVSDFVIPILHWGKENSHQIEDVLLETARLYIDAGADGIVGHHAHMLQGVECYKGKPIFYNIGNFIFSHLEVDNAIVTLKVEEKKKLKWYFTPVSQKNTYVEMIKGEKKRDLLSEVNGWGINAYINEDGLVKCQKKSKRINKRKA